MKQEPTMLKMLIAIDGSEHAQRAMGAVARLASQTKGIEVVLLNVQEGPLYYGELPPFDYESIESRQSQHQRTLLEAALTEARRLGLDTVATQAERGATATEIVRVAAERGVDQIVMGTHGRGAVGGLFLGSIAQRVVHLAKVPVLLVR
jgi:nucleotide-binding universal stress UspA family protein